MMQVSMDGPAVNWKFYTPLQKYRSDCELHQLIDISSCGLHIIHGAFKTGAESTQWELKEIRKGCFRTLYDTPARRDDYISVTGSEMFPLFFCATRWVEDKPVADRLIEIWDNIVNIVR